MTDNDRTKPDVWFSQNRFGNDERNQSLQKDSADVLLRIFVDADACPVKDEIYKVAARYDIIVGLVSNTYLRLQPNPLVKQAVVPADPDAADDFIADRCDHRTIVITADIPLADRAIKTGATVIAPNGKSFTENSIGAAIATRAIMEQLRATGESTGGPPPFTNSDRSKFLQALDTAIVRLRREA